METKNDTELRAQFESSESLQNEFGNDVEAFLYFSRAEASGRVRVSRGGCRMMTEEKFKDSEELESLGEMLEANEQELGRLHGLQAKDEQEQYEHGIACSL